MKKYAFILSLVMVMGFASLGNATLQDRGGGLIYDDAHGLTWLQDANYAVTSGYVTGGMDWYTAMAWADQLTYAGYTDWRLPTGPENLPALTEGVWQIWTGA